MGIEFVFVALGSALGGAGRYAISTIPLKNAFPFLTLMTNVLGAVLIGFIAGLALERPGISKQTILFWKTGVCGGFTTFSTFSLETYDLLAGRHYWLAIFYIAASVGGCLLGIMCGLKLAKICTAR